MIARGANGFLRRLEVHFTETFGRFSVPVRR